MDAGLQKDIDLLVRRLYKLSDKAKKESQDAFRKAAPTLIRAIQSGAPVSKAPHSRYKGGKIVATYQPGNLRKSFKALTFRRSAAVFIGPKLAKGGATLPDGYYAHWMEYGAPAAGIQARPFIRPAVVMVGDEVIRIAIKNLLEKIKNA